MEIMSKWGTALFDRSFKVEKMYLSIIEVKPNPDYLLNLTFENGEVRQFDMKPHLNFGIFQELKDLSLFNTIRISFDTIEWDNKADLDPEFLYRESQQI